jgi:hypothetical protein
VQGQSGETSEAGGSAAGQEEGGKKTGLLEAIRLPLVSVFPRSKLKSTKVTYPIKRLPFAKIMTFRTPAALCLHQRPCELILVLSFFLDCMVVAVHV